MMVKFHHILPMKSALSTLFIFWVLWWGGAYSQHYVNLSVDNDLYFGRDRYYSSGVFISTGRLKSSTDQEGISYKRYVHWTLGQEIYTPSNRYTFDIDQLDYPYGGWLFLERAFEHYNNPFSAWGVSLKIGMTGRASLAPYFQNFYHDKILGLPDVAWLKPLPQRFHFNINLMQRKRLQLYKRLALIYELFGNLGSQRIAAGVRVGTLFGTSDALAFLGNPLEMQTKGYGIYFGTRLEYRYHDYMVSGGLFDDKAPFVLTNIPYKNSLEAGFAFYGKRWRLLTLLNSISRDNERQLARRHYYLNVSIARFF